MEYQINTSFKQIEPLALPKKNTFEYTTCRRQWEKLTNAQREYLNSRHDYLQQVQNMPKDTSGLVSVLALEKQTCIAHIDYAHSMIQMGKGDSTVLHQAVKSSSERLNQIDGTLSGLQE